MDKMNCAGFEYSFNQRMQISEKNDKKMCFRRKPYECPFCDKTFPSEIVLSEHKKTHKGGSFICYCCGEVTATLSKMVAHMRLHLIKEKPLLLAEQIKEVDSLIEIPDEFIEVEPSKKNKNLTNMVESSTNQRKVNDNDKFISNDCNNKKVNNFTNNMKNQDNKQNLVAIDENLTSEENKSIGFVENREKELIHCQVSKNMKRGIVVKNKISSMNQTKKMTKKKKKIKLEKSKNFNDKVIEEKGFSNEETATISNTANSLMNKHKDERNIIDTVVNECLVQNCKIDYNDTFDKKLGKSQVEILNDTSRSNQDNQDVLTREESSTMIDQNDKKSMELDLNSGMKDKGKIKCDQCDYETKYCSNMNVHKKKQKQNVLLKCQYCSFKSQYKRKIDKHKKKHIVSKSKAKKGKHDDNQEILITNDKKSKKDEKMSSKIRKYIKTNENDNSPENILLDNHKVISEVKNLKNEKRKYVKKKKLLVKDKNSNKITYKCKKCTYKCLTKFRMKMHEQIHSNERPFNCPHCEYNTKSKGTLKIHIRKHTGEKPYSCPKCDYRCTNATALKKHVMIHTGEKPFKCSFCDYRCIQSNTLQGHIKTHSNKKFFNCQLCGYSCKLKKSFQLHLETHKGIE